MSNTLILNQLNELLVKAANEFAAYCNVLDDEKFFYQPADKWSPAQQVKHLITATDTARLAYTLPKFIVKLIGGRPNRDSLSYEQLVVKYKQKLEKGGRASGRYIPKQLKPAYGKEKLLNGFERSLKEFRNAVTRKWQDNQLDNYLAPHPLLGKITLRELYYFTIYHSEHHLENIRNLIGNKFKP